MWLIPLLAGTDDCRATAAIRYCCTCDQPVTDAADAADTAHRRRLERAVRGAPLTLRDDSADNGDGAPCLRPLARQIRTDGVADVAKTVKGIAAVVVVPGHVETDAVVGDCSC